MSNKVIDKQFEEVCKMSKDYSHYANGEIIRYNGKHKIKPESIAEHSFMVAINIIKVSKLMCIPDDKRDKAVTMSVLHDISEKYVGDIAYEFKSDRLNKETLDSLFDKYEEMLYNKKYKQEFGNIYKQMYKGSNSVEDRLVKLCDSMSVVQYTSREKVLGNETVGIAEMNKSAKSRVKYDYGRLLKAIEQNGMEVQ